MLLASVWDFQSWMEPYLRYIKGHSKYLVILVEELNYITKVSVTCHGNQKVLVSFALNELAVEHYFNYE